MKNGEQMTRHFFIALALDVWLGDRLRNILQGA